MHDPEQDLTARLRRLILDMTAALGDPAGGPERAREILDAAGHLDPGIRASFEDMIDTYREAPRPDDRGDVSHRSA